MFFLTSTASASTSLYQQIEQQVLADLFNLHPAANINIAFNLPNTQKKFSKCNNFYLPKVKKLSSGGRLSLRLTCKQPNWSTYLTIKTSISYPVAIALVHINKGKKLKTQNVKFVSRDITKLNRGYFTSGEQVFGKEAKRSIKKDQAILPTSLIEATMILKGDSVMIQAQVGGLFISTLGTALQNGREGRQISVKNNRSGKIIRAYVSAIGIVTTTP
jgi:flagella basal body P-ring formation protein FlgA